VPPPHTDPPVDDSANQTGEDPPRKPPGRALANEKDTAELLAAFREMLRSDTSGKV